MSERSAFESAVLADLAVLKAQMAELLGIGQPGRVRDLEMRVKAHERILQRAIGIGAFMGAMLTVIQLAIEYMRVP